jgi:hypothetical protein
MAQRGGGGMRGGGGGGAMRGGGGGGAMRGGGGFGGGFHGGGGVVRGGSGGGFVHGGSGGFFRGGGTFFHGGNTFFRGGRFHNGFGVGFYGGYWPYAYYPYYGYGFGYGYGYGPDYYDYPYYSYPYYGGAYTAGYQQPNVAVVYPQQQQSAPVYVQPETARPISHEYDQYGQETRPAGGGGNSSPIYLLAFRDHSIAAASAYWVDGRTLHYVTLQREEKQAPLDAVDRDLSNQLNRERRVQLQLPQ